MKKRLTAPKIRNYIDWLGRVRYQDSMNAFTYDDRTYELLDEAFKLLESITPVPESDRGVRELWFKADRGPIEDFGDYDEWHDNGDIDSYEEFENWWLSEFPTETIWFDFGSLNDTEIGYKAIFLGNRFVIEWDSRKKRSYENDISEFAEWILESVRNCIDDIKRGIYNDEVERELPPQLRTGTIVRKEWWDIFPELREDFFRDLPVSDVREFLAEADKQPDDYAKTEGRIENLTANNFYSCCSLGYKAIGFDTEGKSLREQYERYADGRDEGLGEIDPDSAQEFSDWYHDRKRMGGHPWEVCRGGNSTHIDLRVNCDADGYFLSIAGAAVGRTVETIKFYLALRRAGKPVFIYNAVELSARLIETEKIGVVPDGVMPKYCSSMFPGEKVITFMNLPYEKREEVAAHCVWQPLFKASLITPTEEGAV